MDINMKNNICRICDTENNVEEYVLKEMMFGLMDEFEYFKCSNCGCLQIKHFPENMKKYYPLDYLSYPEPSVPVIKKFLGKKREKSFLSGKGIIGKLLLYFFGFNDPDLLWFSEAHIRKNDFILEVGCGQGKLLKKLYDSGFNNLLGVDPFISEDINYKNNLKIIKKDFLQVENMEFDWIMFHHSFEHLKDPVATFIRLNKLIKKNGNVLIRIPVIDSYAWNHYGTDWVQLDPPRHCFLHTVKSIEYLSNKFNFKIKNIIYDSTSFQFLGSEQYKKHIPLMSPKSYFKDPDNSIFKEEDVNYYTEKAKELNSNKKGDTACFYLQRLN